MPNKLNKRLKIVENLGVMIGVTRGVHADGHISGRDRVRIGGMGATGMLIR